MGMVLRVDGSVGRDGLPRVEPPGAWRPAWAGLARPHPGQAVVYAADLRGGVERTLRLPYSTSGGPHQVASDVAEADAPLRSIGRRGLLFERAATQELEAADWDISTWTAQDSSAVTAGGQGPTDATTGEGQAYRFSSTAAGGYRQLTETTGTNLNATTYVFSVWLRRTTGTAAAPARLVFEGSAVVTKDFTVGDEWQHCWVTSPNDNTTTAKLRILPSPSGTGTIVVWGPTLVATGTPAATTDRGRRSTISPSGVSVAPLLSGPFAWPAPPWTLYCRFRPHWGAADEQSHSALGCYSSAGTSIFRLTKASGGDLEAVLRNFRGTNQTASTTPTLTHGAEWRVVVRVSELGALQGYLNGVPFDAQVAAPAALPAGPATTLDLGNDTLATGALDGLLDHVELWDEYLEPRRFY